MTIADRTTPAHPCPPTARAQRACTMGGVVFVLLIAPAVVHAREVRMQSPNGDGGSGMIEMSSDSSVKADIARKSGDPAAQAAEPAKAPPMVRNPDEGSTIRPPRWHRLLPGMLR